MAVSAIFWTTDGYGQKSGAAICSLRHGLGECCAAEFQSGITTAEMVRRRLLQAEAKRLLSRLSVTLRVDSGLSYGQVAAQNRISPNPGRDNLD
jgi:hypothetical protein